MEITTRLEPGLASFVVRFKQERWRDEQGEPHLEWRGQIQHVQGDESAAFTDFAEAVAFMQRHLQQLTQSAWSGGDRMQQEKLARESFKLWEQFTSAYTDMLVQSMETGLKQSEAFRQQMDQAVERTAQAWQPAASAADPAVLETLRALQAQVKALADKVEALEKAGAQ